MKCFACGGDVIWGGDHDEEDDDGTMRIVTNLHCPDCEAFYLMYWGEYKEADSARED